MEVFSENIFWVKILNRVAWAIDCSETLNLEPTLCFCRFDYAETKFSGFLLNLSVFFQFGDHVRSVWSLLTNTEVLHKNK